MITGAGGALGAVIKETGIQDQIIHVFSDFPFLGILLPFLVASLLTISTGSITVSLVSSASMIAPMIDALPVSPEMVAALIGCGSFCVFHANSSFFWLLNRLHEVPPTVLYKKVYRTILVDGIVRLDRGIYFISFWNMKKLKIAKYIYIYGIATFIQIHCNQPENSKDFPKGPNVLLIMVDDLNDNIGVLGGHPQSITPHLDRLAQSGVLFTNAHCNAPMCGPSRASMLTGVYPHHSNNYFQSPWHNFDVLKNTRTIMEQFMLKGYDVLGTGKILHHNRPELWTHFENPADLYSNANCRR